MFCYLELSCLLGPLCLRLGSGLGSLVLLKCGLFGAIWSALVLERSRVRWVGPVFHDLPLIHLL